jgi:alpha-galactosidase
MTNVNAQLLAAEAAIQADPERLVQAVALDPLAGAVCTLGEIREMCAAMLEAERAWLPGFAGKCIAAKPVIVIPPECRPVDVPLDPALAIGKRFGMLVEQPTATR